MSIKGAVVLVLVVLACAAAGFNVGHHVGAAVGFDRGKVAGYTVGRQDEAAVAIQCPDDAAVRARLWSEVESEVSGRDAAEWREVVEEARAEACVASWSRGYAQGRDDWRRVPFLEVYAR